MPPSNAVSCIPVPDYGGLLNIENWEISSSETLTGRTVRVILPLYIRLISDSLTCALPTCQFYLSISDVKRPSEFSEHSASLAIETFTKTAANW